MGPEGNQQKAEPLVEQEVCSLEDASWALLFLPRSPCLKEHLNKMYVHPHNRNQNPGFISIRGIYCAALSSCSHLCSLTFFYQMTNLSYTSEKKDLTTLQKFPRFFKNHGKKKMSPGGPENHSSQFAPLFIDYAQNLSTYGRRPKPYANHFLSMHCNRWAKCSRTDHMAPK